MSLIQNSLSASVMILIVIILRSTFLNKIPKSTFLWLWYIVTARLLLPMPVTSPLSVGSFVQVFRGTLEGAYPPMEPFQGLSLGFTGASTSIVPHSLGGVWDILWGIGAFSFAVFFAVKQRKGNRGISLLTPADRSILNHLPIENKILQRIKIYFTTDSHAPVTYGVFRPSIVLPDVWSELPQAERDYLILHEVVHIQRFDAIFKFFLLITLTVHWFNPFVWLMYYLAIRDIEIACDEAVIKKAGENAKRTYAELLVNMAAPASSAFSLDNGFGRGVIKERVVSIMTYKKAGWLAVSISLALVLGTSTVFATSPPQPQPLYGNTAVSRDADQAHMLQTHSEYAPALIPVSTKAMFFGLSGAHTIPWEEAVIYTNGNGVWALNEGQQAEITLQITPAFPQGQVIAIGYIDIENGIYTPIYYDYLVDTVSLSFQAPTSGRYNFFVYANSSEPVEVDSFSIHVI